MSIERGTTVCLSCNAEATAMWDGPDFKVVCDACGYELWGRAVNGPPILNIDGDNRPQPPPSTRPAGMENP